MDQYRIGDEDIVSVLDAGDVADVTTEEWVRMSEVPAIKDWGAVPESLRAESHLLHVNPNSIGFQNIKIPEVYNVELYDPTGSVNMGWPSPVKPTGQFENGDWYRALEHFPSPNDASWNAYCFLVILREQISERPDRYHHHFLRNSRVKWGASVGTGGVYWEMGHTWLNRDFDVFAGFNDEDTNNSGHFRQRLRFWNPREFAFAHRRFWKRAGDERK